MNEKLEYFRRNKINDRNYFKNYFSSQLYEHNRETKIVPRALTKISFQSFGLRNKHCSPPELEKIALFLFSRFIVQKKEKRKKENKEK